MQAHLLTINLIQALKEEQESNIHDAPHSRAVGADCEEDLLAQIGEVRLVDKVCVDEEALPLHLCKAQHVEHKVNRRQITALQWLIISSHGGISEQARGIRAGT